MPLHPGPTFLQRILSFKLLQFICDRHEKHSDEHRMTNILHLFLLFSFTFHLTFCRRCGLVGAMPLRTPNSLNYYTRMALPSWVRLRNCKGPFSTIDNIMHMRYLIGGLWHLLGPPSQAMWSLGDKIASSIVAQTAGIPTLPWSGTGLSVPLSVLSFLLWVWSLTVVVCLYRTDCWVDREWPEE